MDYLLCSLDVDGVNDGGDATAPVGREGRSFQRQNSAARDGGGDPVFLGSAAKVIARIWISAINHHFMLKHIFDPIIKWYLEALQTGGLFLVALLMAVESSIVPLPSEVIIPPAAHLAWTQGLNFYGAHFAGWLGQIGIVIAGAIGSWLGATVMYWLSRWAGRPLVLRYGKYFFISAAKVEGAERWAANYGAFGIFASRLLPVVRHLIGIPAGIVRMNYWVFSLYTLLGSALWCAVLCWLGVKIGADISKGEMHKVTFWLVGFLLGVGGLYYFFVHRHMTAGKVDTGKPPAKSK